MSELNREAAVQLICETLRGLDVEVASLDESTALLGNDGVVDSIGLVNLIMDVEMQLNDTRETPVTIADERALSQTRSPFRTVGSLADHIVLLLRG
jgi:acyl carrier protein